MTTPEIPPTLVLPVEFHFDPDPAHLPDLMRKAREIDHHNAGQVQVEYTFEQALVTVFHEEGLEGLKPLLVGWTIYKDVDWGPAVSPTDPDEDDIAFARETLPLGSADEIQDLAQDRARVRAQERARNAL